MRHYSVLSLLLTACLFAWAPSSAALDLKQEEQRLQTLSSRLAEALQASDLAYAEFAAAAFSMWEAQKAAGKTEEIATPAMLEAGKKLLEAGRRVQDLAIEIEIRRTIVADQEKANAPGATATDKYYAALDIATLRLYAEEQETRTLLADADARFQELEARMPQSSELVREWATAQWRLAMKLPPEERTPVYDACALLYARSLDLAATEDDRSIVLWHWGAFLQQQGVEHAGAERARFFREADAKYEQAAESDGGNRSSWGEQIAERARLAEGEERAALYRKALALYGEAVDSADEAWGTVPLQRRCMLLMEYAKFLQGEGQQPEALAVLEEAENVLTRVTDAGEDASCLLARVSILQGRTAECEEWLNACAERCSMLLFPLEELETEPEWAAVRDTPWFLRDRALLLMTMGQAAALYGRQNR